MASSAEVTEKYGKTKTDTGSTEVQVALITDRINHLNGHFKTHPHDHHSKRGLFTLVGQRRRLMKYLRGKSETRYSQLVKSLGLRK